MKCNKCGTEFKEGVFCPECGTKYTEKETELVEQSRKEKVESEQLAEEKAETERIAMEKAEAERIAKEKAETERRAKERAEAERLAKERAEIERLTQENAKRDLDSRTVRGTVYKSLEEAEQAKREHNLIDVLKSQLMTTKSQHKRKEIFGQFNEQIVTIDAKSRYELLKAKITQEVPLSEKINSIYGITVLITFLLTITIMMAIEGEAPLLGKICIIWCGFGVWIWPIWKFVLFVKSKSRNYYKNIKNI